MKWLVGVVVVVALIVGVLAPLVNVLNQAVNDGVAAATADVARAKAAAAWADASAAQARAAAEKQASAAWAAEQATRERTLTGVLMVIGLAVGAVLIATAAAWARWSWMRAGMTLIEPVEASGKAFPAIAQGGAVTLLPAPQMASSRRVEIAAPEPAQMLTAPDPLPGRVEVGTWLPGQGLALPLGVSEDGPVAVPVGGWALGLAAGLPGMGKTSLLQSMLMGLLRADGTGNRVQIAIIDVKRADFGGLRSQAALWAPVARDTDEAGRLLQALRVEMDRRFQALEAAGVDSWEALRLAPIVLIADELAVLATDDAISRDLLYLGRLGRAAGVRVIAATQRPSSRVIPSDLRALADWTVAFSVRSQADSRVILDCGGAERLPRQPGRALLKRDDLSTIQCYHPGDWGGFVRSLPMTTVPELVTPAQIDGSAQANRLLDAEPVAQPVSRLEWDQAPTAEIAEAMRAAHQAGASLNAICRQWYGGKNGRAFEHVRQAVIG